MNASLLSAAFLMGLLGLLHCVTMCGSISAVLTFSLPAEVQAQPNRLLAYLSYYNLGRLISYGLVGALSGAFGAGLFFSLSPEFGHAVLMSLATSLMILTGLYLAGWFPKFAYIERIGRPIWHYLEPWGKKLIPVRHAHQALLYGMIWGWLPCGLVYTALFMALTQGSALNGALFMFFFGLGTLPATLLSSLFAQQMMQWANQNSMKKIAGMGLILFSLISFFSVILEQ